MSGATYRAGRDSHLHLTCAACAWVDSFAAELPAAGDKAGWTRFLALMREERIIVARCPSCDHPWDVLTAARWPHDA